MHALAPGAPQTTGDAERRAAVAIKPGRKGAAQKIRFGDVVVTVRAPTKADVQRSVELGTAALERVKGRLTRPGIRLYAKKGVPLFFADPDTPGMFIRKLNGRRDRGVLENGQFKVTG